MSPATEYALRVLAGQSNTVGAVERVRRVGRALDGQGMELRDAKLGVLLDKVVLQLAVKAFQSASGPSLEDRVQSVASAMNDIGMNIDDVFPASKGYWKLKTRKARKERLHS